MRRAPSRRRNASRRACFGADLVQSWCISRVSFACSTHGFCQSFTPGYAAQAKRHSRTRENREGLAATPKKILDGCTQNGHAVGRLNTVIELNVDRNNRPHLLTSSRSMRVAGFLFFESRRRISSHGGAKARRGAPANDRSSLLAWPSRSQRLRVRHPLHGKAEGKFCEHC